MKTKLNTIAVAVLQIVFLALPNTLLAQSGSLDLTFGNNGKVNTSFSSGTAEGNAIAIQTDGKIIIAGFTFNGTHYNFALVRYNTNGTLDTSFGNNGKVTTAFGATSNDRAYGVAIQSDGKIVAVGFSASNGTNQDFALARYNTNGSLDTSFDSDGKVTTAIGNSTDVAFAVSIQSDGKIVTAGYSLLAFNDDFTLIRYNSNGSLDSTFGTNGIVTTDVGNVNNDMARSLILQPDGKILAAGFSANASNTDFAVVRYNTNGNLDSSFGNNGKVVTPIGSGNDEAYAIALQADGKIVTAGKSHNGSDFDIALVRYNTNGTLDTAFDTDGKVTTAIEFGNEIAFSVAIQSDGKILTAGYSYINFNNDFALLRYNTNGTLDPTFDTDGIVTTPILASDIASALAIQTDGKIVVAGYSFNGTSNEFTVVRYYNNMTMDINSMTIQNSEIKIYPIPSTNSIQISGLDNTENYEIFNILGLKITNGNVSINEKINIQNLRNGNYFIKLENGQVIRFIKE